MNTTTTIISNITWNNPDPGLDITLEGDMFPRARKVMDFFKAAKPALMDYAKRAGKNVLSAGATVVKDVMGEKMLREECFFSEAAMSDDTVSRTTGKKREVPGNQGGKSKNPRCSCNIFN